jgi:hypothetical protein
MVRHVVSDMSLASTYQKTVSMELAFIDILWRAHGVPQM